MLPSKMLYLIWLILSFCSSYAKVKVCIAGGGPAGLLAAYALLHRRNTQYEVHLYDSNTDPRSLPPGPRSYSLGLNMRGQGAIKHFAEKYSDPALFPIVEKEGVYCDSFFVYLLGQRFAIRKAKTEALFSDGQTVPPTLLLPRNRLAGALLSRIEQRFPHTPRFRTRLGTKVVAADLGRREVTLSDGRRSSYDLLIGADGLQSAVRDSMLFSPQQDESPFEADVTSLGGNFKVMLQDCPANLENDCIHFMELGGLGKAGFGLFVIPSLNNKVCVLTLWQGEAVPPVLQAGTPVDKVQEIFEKYYPMFGKPSEEAVAQLQSQRPSPVKVVRCNRYHDTPGRVALIGDAAHCTGGALGQGANSALQDVVIFDQMLDYSAGDLSTALPLYSSLQVPEGLALWKLLQLPPKNPVYGLAYQTHQWLVDQINKVDALKRRKVAPQTVQNLISKSTVPFSEIADQNLFWIKVASSEWDRFEYTPESFLSYTKRLRPGSKA